MPQKLQRMQTYLNNIKGIVTERRKTPSTHSSKQPHQRGKSNLTVICNSFLVFIEPHKT